jgi:hypothetical protein
MPAGIGGANPMSTNARGYGGGGGVAAAAANGPVGQVATSSRQEPVTCHIDVFCGLKYRYLKEPQDRTTHSAQRATPSPSHPTPPPNPNFKPRRARKAQVTLSIIGTTCYLLVMVLISTTNYSLDYMRCRCHANS